MTFFKKKIYYSIWLTLLIICNENNSQNNLLKIGLESALTSAISMAASFAILKGIEKSLKIYELLGLLSCENPPFNTTKNESEKVDKKIKNLIEKIKKETNRTVVIFVSPEPYITNHEIETIKNIPQELNQPFCYINPQKKKASNILNSLKKNIKKETVYFLNTALLKEIKKEEISLLSGLNKSSDFGKKTAKDIIEEIIHIFLFSIRSDKQATLVIYANKEDFSTFQSIFPRSFQENIIEFELPNSEKRIELLNQFTKKLNITLNQNISNEFIIKITKDFSVNDLNSFFTKMLEIIDELQASGICDINKKILKRARKEIIQEKKKRNNSQKNNNPQPQEGIDLLFEEKKFEPHIICSPSFEDISGYEETKNELIKIALEIKNNKKKSKGILLWGPPGNGKTLFAKALAGELQIPFFNIKGSDLQSPLVGKTEQNIKNLFLAAKENRPCIVFIDEADSLTPNRNNNTISSFNQIGPTNEFLAQLTEAENILFIIATNRPESLDQALLRPGRIDKKCLIGKPQKKDRIAIISDFIEEHDIEFNPKDFDIEETADILSGFSCAEINDFMEKIAEKEEINKKDIIDIYKKIQKESNIGKFAFSKSDTSFDDIAGYEYIKKEINQEIIKKLSAPKAMFEKIPGCIISGPPGTGKTLLGEAIAKEANVSYIKINMTQLLEEHPHGIEKLFESIEKNRPCVVIFDEAEEIFKKREQASNYQKHIITEFLERTGSKNSLKGVCFIAITNYPNLIDEAIKRPGRLGKKYTLKNPLFEDRIEIIKLYLEKLEIEIDKSSLSLKTCAERTDGMLPAEIEALLENAKELMLEKNEDKMNQDIFAEAYQQALLGKKTAIRLDEKEITQTAYHEAAHGLVTFLLEKEGQSLHFFDFLTIEPRAHALGISFSRAKAEYKSMTKEMMLGLISVFLAGKAAQEIIFNQTDAGAGDDLQKATQIAQSFIKTYGMSNTLYTNPDSTNSEKEKDEIEKILQEQYKKVKEFLKKNKKLLDKIVKKVIEKKIIYERDLELIIKEYEEEIKQKVKFKAN